MTKPALREAFAKRSRGEELTADEQELLRAYARNAIKLSTRIYWDSAPQKEEYQKLAEEQGSRNFSAWLIKQIERGAKASPLTRDEVKQLREQVEEANKRLDREAENGVYFREKSRQFERQRDEAQEKILKLEEELAELQGQVEGKLARRKTSGGKA
jgi:hypothetical protein